MKKKLIRLTESDLHTVIKEVIQNLIDAEPYQDFDNDGDNEAYAFDLNEFFMTNESGNFIHDKDVDKF